MLLLDVQACQQTQRQREFTVIRIRLAVGFHRPQAEFLRFLRLARLAADDTEVMERESDERVIFAMRLLANLQPLAMKLLGLAELLLEDRQVTQVVVIMGHCGRVRPIHLFVDLQRPAVVCLRLVELALVFGAIPQPPRGRGDSWVERPQQFLEQGERLSVRGSSASACR